MAAGKLVHKYFGPKDKVTGEMMEEPTYAHQSLPAMLYHPEWAGWPLNDRVFNTDEEVADALKDGWVKSPADLGEVTCPSQEQLDEIKFAAIKKGKGK